MISYVCMRVCICMYVRKYVCAHVPMRACMSFACVHACMQYGKADRHTCTNTRVQYVPVLFQRQWQKHGYASQSRTQARTHTHAYKYKYKHTRIYIYSHMHKHVCIYVNADTHPWKYTRIYTHIYIPACIRTYIHTHMACICLPFICMYIYICKYKFTQAYT